MFSILAASALMLIIPIFFRKNSTRRYEQLSICAVNDEDMEVEVTTPSELPARIKYFIITFTVADVLYKICRDSVTVPQSVKKINKFRFTQAIAIKKDGETSDVTELLQVYSGPVGNFTGNDISVVEILKHHNVHDVYSVLTIARDTSTFGIFQDPVILFHTAEDIVDVEY